LVVAVSDLPGGFLPGVTVESQAIKALIPDARLPADPDRGTVLEALPAYRIAHFACHGRPVFDYPDHSHLVLADHQTAPLTVEDIRALTVRGGLAYLSACSTKATVQHLLDESVHLANAFHLAGYRYVIGTLWPIDDGAAAEVAAEFYSILTVDGSNSPRIGRSAHALHHAIRRLRKRHPDLPTLWAAYTHTGM
jgi:CHAT domain-containing protein